MWSRQQAHDIYNNYAMHSLAMMMLIILILSDVDWVGIDAHSGWKDLNALID